MNGRIVFTTPEGSVSVLIPSGEISIAKVKSKDVPENATNVREITIAELPANRHYRNAWDDSNPESFVGINVAKAAEMAHARRRVKRDKIFAPNIKILSKDSAGIPLGPNENAADAASANAAYKANIDDVAQEAIEAAVIANDIEAMEAAEIAAGLL